jgi:hypothetical protein
MEEAPNMSLPTRIKIRRDNSSAWVSVNPVLSSGEIGFESNTKKLKIGDGTTPWNSLDYTISQEAQISALSDVNDVNISNILNGDILQWSGTEWVNVQQAESAQQNIHPFAMLG